MVGLFTPFITVSVNTYNKISLLATLPRPRHNTVTGKGVHPLRSLATSVLIHFGPFAIKDRSGCPVRSFVTSVLCQFGP